MQNTLSLDTQSIGSALRLARVRMGITFRELCAASGVAPSQILRVESGQHDFTFGTAMALCGPLSLRPGLLLECGFQVNREHYDLAYSNEIDKGAAPSRFAKFINESGKDYVKEEEPFKNYVVAAAMTAEYLLRSSAPVKFLKTINFIADGQREQFEKLASKLSAKPLPYEDLIDHLQALQSSIFMELERLELLDPAAVERFIRWRKTFAKRKDYFWIPEPFGTGDKLAEFLFS